MPKPNSNFTKLLILTLLLFFIPRVVGLGADISNSDALRWHRRSQYFLEALKAGDLKSTYQHYQPGITLMWLNAVVKQAVFSYQLFTTGNPQTLENADFFPILHAISKLSLLGVLGILLVFQAVLIRQLFSDQTALVYVFLVAIEPYLVGIDRWFHLTSLETYLAFVTFLTLLYWTKVQKPKLIPISAGFFALSVLSKLTSLILTPLFLLIFINNYFRTKQVKPFFVFAGVSLATFIILFPAMWVSPVLVVQKLYDAIFNAVGSDVTITSDSLQNSFYLMTLLFKMSPFTLLVIVLCWLNGTKVKHGFYIFGYFLVYLVFLTLASKKIDRYVISLFPPLLLVAAISLANLSSNKGLLLKFAGVLFLVSVFITTKNVFSAYYSPVFGGTGSAIKLGIYDNSGEYFAPAALYLNDKGRDAYTCVPNNFDSFFPFYEGNAQMDCDGKTSFVVQSIDTTRPMFTGYGSCVLERSFGADVPVVAVYRCR